MTSVESVVHVIQVSLTPIFLLSGIASLLGVFSTRLARVADRADDVAERLTAAGETEANRLRARLVHLRRRSHALDTAVVLAILGGVATCVTVILIFVGSLRAEAGTSLFGAFGAAGARSPPSFSKCCSPAAVFAIR